MKKITVLILAIFMSLTLMLTSCDIPFLNGGETTGEETAQAPETTTAVEENTTAPAEESKTTAPENTENNAPEDTGSTNEPSNSLEQGGANTDDGWGAIITP